MFPENNFARTFSKLPCDAFLENEGKLYYMKEDMLNSFFRKLVGWHLATSSRINFFADNFQGF